MVGVVGYMPQLLWVLKCSLFHVCVSLASLDIKQRISFRGLKNLIVNVQGEKGAQILLVPDLVDFLTSALNKVFMPLKYYI